MKKLGRNTLALGMSTLLVTSAVALSANAAPGDVAQANSSAITATGLTEIVNTGVCLAESADGTPVAVEDAEGLCGTGLELAGVTGTVNQTASTGLDGNRGTSVSRASVEQVTLTQLPDIDLSNIDNDVLGIQTGTILDGIVQGADPLLRPVLEAAIAPLLTAIQQAALTPILEAVQGSLPVAVRVGAVASECSAVAGEPAVVSSTVASIDIVVGPAADPLLVVPIDLPTSENAALVGSVAPQELVNGLLNGLQATLEQSLGGVLAPLNLILGTVQDQVINALLDAVGPALLDPVGEALTPILTGTVNKVERDGEAAEVTALSLNLLSDTATLDIARSACGPNGLAVVDDAAAAAGDDTQADDDADAQADGTIADAAADAQADAIADADAQADADVTTSLPNAGAPNLLPFWLLGLGLVAFGAAVLVNERRRALI